MSSEPIRDPAGDRLLTPQNAAFIVIDYQPRAGEPMRSAGGSAGVAAAQD